METIPQRNPTMSLAATVRFQTKTTEAVITALKAGTANPWVDQQGVVVLSTNTVVWGTDVPAIGELRRDCTAVRPRQGGAWVALDADATRMARMADAVARGAAAVEAKRMAAEQARASALVGTLIMAKPAKAYGQVEDPALAHYRVVRTDGPYLVAVPAGWTRKPGTPEYALEAVRIRDGKVLDKVQIKDAV